MACHIMGVPLSQYRKRIPMENAALNVFAHKEGKWQVVALNDISHLIVPRVEPPSGPLGE
jgi:hypothetical protein